MAEKLKPCLCGSDDLEFKYHISHGGTFVHCNDCGVTSRGWFDDEDIAQAKVAGFWNDRPATPTLSEDDIKAALREAFESGKGIRAIEEVLPPYRTSAAIEIVDLEFELMMAKSNKRRAPAITKLMSSIRREDAKGE